MKFKTVFTSLVLIAGTLTLFLTSCDKGSDDYTPPAPPTPVPGELDGAWETSAWFDPKDTLRISITSSGAKGTGVLTYRNAQGIVSGFLLGDQLYKDITKTGNGTFNATIYYRYGPANAQLGYTTGVLTLQNGGTVLFADASTDPLTGNVVPDHYFKKK